jgi:ComF family protein
LYFNFPKGKDRPVPCCGNMLKIFSDFFSLIYPRYCLACADALVTGEDTICTGCLLDMPKTNQHQLINNALQQRLSLRFSVKHAYAFYYFKKASKVQKLLHELKYKNHPEIGVRLGYVMGTQLAERGLSSEWDVIVPVPLHASRKRSRGYNQSEEFAKGLSQALGIPYTENFVKRNVKTQTQTRKTKLSRWKNVREVFAMKNEREVKDKRILLADDVVTTGATLEACATALLQAGCADVSVVCIAEA